MRPGALILAVMLAGASMIPCSNATDAQEPMVAIVNGEPITQTDVLLAASKIAPALQLLPPERRRPVSVEYLISSQLFADAAEEAGIAAGPEFEARLLFAMRSIMAELYFEKRTFPAVTEADVRRYYNERVAGAEPEDEVHVRHILVASEALARDLRARIIKGTDFAALAKALSDDQGTAWQGGEIGWRVKQELEDRFAAAAFALQNKGDLSEPVQTRFGWHLILLEDRRERALPKFAAVKDRIRRLLVRRNANEVGRRLREKAEIIYLEPDLQPDVASGAAPASATETESGETN